MRSILLPLAWVALPCFAPELELGTMNVENLGEEVPGMTPKATGVKEERVARIMGPLLGGLMVVQEVHSEQALERVLRKAAKGSVKAVHCSSSKMQKVCVAGDRALLRGVDEIPVEIVESNGSRKELRPFLRTRWRPAGATKDVVLLGAHLPAPYHSLEMRREAMIKLTQEARKIAAEAELVLAAGDFNTPRKDEDAVHLYRHWELASRRLGIHQGTYYHAKQWHFLDNVLIYKKAGAKAKFVEVKVVKDRAFQKMPSGVPLRFDMEKLEGVSDHFPLWTKLRW